MSVSWTVSGGLLGATLLAAALLVTGCPVTPDPCLWVVTNNVGTLAAPTDFVILQLRDPGGEWGENILGEDGTLPFGESLSFLLAPGLDDLDVRAWDAEASSWSRYEAGSCEDGQRIETVITADDLDVPCNWDITNLLGDSGVNYALLEIWVRIAGGADWGPGTLGGVPLAFEETLELAVETGYSFDVSAVDQDGIYYLLANEQECRDGEDLSSTISLSDEAPPCIWQVTNTIDGDFGPVSIVALTVTPSGTAETIVYQLPNTLSFGDVSEVPFFPRAVWDLQAVDELGQTYTYPEAALCLDGGELYALDVVAEDVDPAR
ncbi:MAG: hypothetical protein KDA24_14570 [Deltaproteobacteria bacterium]|nr:hypothetical protein [Deltaproteobacteria bacterium]